MFYRLSGVAITYLSDKNVLTRWESNLTMLNYLNVVIDSYGLMKIK